MKVLFSLNPGAVQGGGSVSFARTLADALEAAGVRVFFDLDAPADVLLVFAHAGTERLLRRSRRRGARVVQRLDERIDPGERGARREKHRHLLALNRLADMTIFQSEFVRGNVGPWCGAAASRVIRNGVDTRVFRPDGPREDLPGDPAVLHASWSIGESKRLDRIAELLAAAPPGLRLHLVGRHAETRAPWLSDPRVVVHGPQPREVVARLMRSATLLFFPSELEPCPNTPIEAMASGLPALYHPSGGTPELLGDAGVPMTSSLADDLPRALAARATLRARLRDRAAQFSADRACADYLAAFRAALAAPPAPAPAALARWWAMVRPGVRP